jgi:pimeloyl-ACP methyl ester carboxylesterase
VIASELWRASNGVAFQATDGHDGIVDLRHYTATFRTWGEGPPLVLVPGLAGSYHLLGPLARELSRTHTVIAPSLRAEDDCFALRRRFDIRDMADDLCEFIDSLGLERPAVCGVSFGGVIAAEFAASYPNRLSTLVLQGVGDRYERGLLQRIARIVLSAYPLPADNAFVNQFFNLLLGRGQSAETLRFVARQCWRTDQSVIARRLRLVERCDLSGRLSRVTVPTLAIAGERDLLASAASLRRLCDALPIARSVRIPGGHLACVTHARRMAEEIVPFLARRR